MYCNIRRKEKKDIKDTIKTRLEAWLTGNSTGISKIRISGYNEDGHNIWLDTELLKKNQYIETELENDTKIVDSKKMFEKLIAVAKEPN